jgi:1A family penicillin-binding protein
MMLTSKRMGPGFYLVGSILIICGIAAGAGVHRLWQMRSEIERLANQLTLDAGPESTLLYDSNNELVSALFEEHRIAVPLERISPHLVNAVLVTEDRRFYEHYGVDPRRIISAAVANWRAGEIVQGASTITQQLVRSLLLNREKSYLRKFREALLARRLEERYSKRAILAAYLNRVYFGDGFYGIEAASRGYFGKTAAELDAVESALLAGLIKGPSFYSPTKAPERARERRNFVLARLRDHGILPAADVQSAMALPVTAQLADPEQARASDLRRMKGAEYFRDAVERELIRRFGTEAVHTGGYRVYTTLDRRLQQLAEEAVVIRLARAPRDREPPQGALVAIEPRTGFVRALVGGRDFSESPFNRAIDARRQPGSAFKPFIFAMALESGYAPSTRLEGLDQPIATAQGPWLPRGEHETESVRLREALVASSNRAAAHLLQEVGVNRTRSLVERFGVSSQMPNVPSLALGTGELTLFELTSAYGVFANRGVWREPTLIMRVLDRHGQEIYRAPATERVVVSEATAFLMNSMMADVINRGTASTARAAGFRIAAAGKTGTSQSFTDAWFVGYTPQLVTGVWFGYDQPQTIMARGFASVVAVPAWARFMAAALRDAKSEWFEMPGSLMKVKLCRISGLLATDRCHLPVLEEAPATSEFPDAPREMVLREGGVYDEFRHVSRLPEPCHLLHGMPDSVVDDVWLTGAIDAARPEMPPAAPPPPPAPVFQGIVPGTIISTAPPVPPRPPGNGSPEGPWR